MAANSNTPEIEEVFKIVKEKINTDFNLESIEQKKEFESIIGIMNEFETKVKTEMIKIKKKPIVDIVAQLHHY